VPSQELVLREFARVLKPGGIAGFSEPGPHHSKHAGAQFEMRNFRVIENDIDLTYIDNVGKLYGFTEMKIAVAPIHPTMVPLESLESFFADPRPYVAGIYERVTNYPVFFMYKGDPTIRDSRTLEGLCAEIKVDQRMITTDSSSAILLRLEALNSSPKTWLPSGAALGSVNIGGFLERTDSTEIVPAKEFRFSLSRTNVEPGETANAEINLGPLESGSYRFDIDLVSEQVCWFQTYSNSRVSVEILVR
jgi:hypothetical protein